MRFWHLDLDERFFIGKLEFIRTGLFTAWPRKFGTPHDTLQREGSPDSWRFVAPWTRVKTTRLVRRKSLLETLANKDAARLARLTAKALAAKSPFLNMVGGGSFPSGVSDEIRSGNPVHPAYRSAPIMPTDDGKSSIHGTPISREKALEGLGDPATWPAEEAKLLVESQAKPDLNRPRVEQPNSDNNVTGPTS